VTQGVIAAETAVKASQHAMNGARARTGASRPPIRQDAPEHDLGHDRAHPKPNEREIPLQIAQRARFRQPARRALDDGALLRTLRRLTLALIFPLCTRTRSCVRDSAVMRFHLRDARLDELDARAERLEQRARAKHLHLERGLDDA
jgi:hypothetical protein